MSRNEGTPVAVVTGGTGALGHAVVREMIARGFRVHVPWRNRDSAAELRSSLGDAAAEGLVLEEADLGDPADVERFFRPLVEAGRLDLLCNLAGGFAAADVGETSSSVWRRMVDTNATSAFLSTRAAIPALRAGGGAVVNVGTIPSLEGGGAGMSAYVASKASVLALTKAWAKELRADGIRVNAIAPEIIDTPSNRAAMPDADRSTWLRPSDIASVIAFLASDDARVVTGSVLVLRGPG